MNNNNYIRDYSPDSESIKVYKMLLNGEIKIFPMGFWTNEESKEKAIEISKWLIEKKLNWTDDDLKRNFSLKTFKENKLYGMLTSCFNSSPYIALDNIYPNKFKAWELKSVPNNYWSIEHGIEAVRWLIEDILQWSDLQIKANLSSKTFHDNNLSGMFRCCFKESTYNAINMAYPNKFKKEDLKSYTDYTIKNLVNCY